jgi:hypothetical protein
VNRKIPGGFKSPYQFAALLRAVEIVQSRRNMIHIGGGDIPKHKKLQQRRRNDKDPFLLSRSA